jgi:hypothetical protein
LPVRWQQRVKGSRVVCGTGVFYINGNVISVFALLFSWIPNVGAVLKEKSG